MNKQEAIEELAKITDELCSNWIHITTATRIVCQIDEPQKVKVPQFVAEWYRITLESGCSPLEDFLNIILTMGRYEGRNPNYNYDTGMYKWIKETPDAIQIVANMHQFGYEVEQEKRYRVKIENNGSQPLTLKKLGPRIFFVDEECDECFTKQEIEQAGFAWLFDCDGAEVEEVEE